MTYFNLKLLHFAFLFLYIVMISKMVFILFFGESFWEIHLVNHILVPFALVFIFEFVLGFLKEKTYSLQIGQNQTVIQKLYSLGYLPTSDAGPKFFYKKRKLFGWKTARIEEGEDYLLLKIMEKLPELE